MSRRAWVEQVMGLPVSIHLRGPDVRGSGGRARGRRRIRRAGPPGRGVLDLPPGVTRQPAPSRGPRCRLRRPAGRGGRRLCALATERTGGAFTAWLPDGDGVVRWDPTGLVKGWAVDRAGRELTGLPATAWSVNAGGDVLVGRHRSVPPEGGGRGAVADRGGGPARPVADGGRGAVDHGCRRDVGNGGSGVAPLRPRVASAGRPRGLDDGRGRDAVWADVWATALFVGGEAARDAFARNAPGAQMFAA